VSISSISKSKSKSKIKIQKKKNQKSRVFEIPKDFIRSTLMNKALKVMVGDGILK